MVNITNETYENNGIKVITDKVGELWLKKDMFKNNQDLKIYLHLQTNMI